MQLVLNMAKWFLLWLVLGMITFFVGVLISFLMIKMAFDIGWSNTEQILLTGMGGMFSLSVVAVAATNQIRKKQLEMVYEDIRDLKDKKAEVKDITNLQCQIDLVHDTLEKVASNQEKSHETITQMYQVLLNSKLGGK